MLDQLFGSKTRVALLKLFFENPDRSYFVRELTREIGAQINSVRRELNNLLEIGIVQILEKPREPLSNHPNFEPEKIPGLNRKKYYGLDRSFVLLDELSGLFNKSHLLFERDLMIKLKTIGDVAYIAMAGYFVGSTESPTDMLLVGNVDRAKLKELLKMFEQKLNNEINFTIMTEKEYHYRRDITDKFLYDILMNPKIVVVDRLTNEKPE